MLHDGHLELAEKLIDPAYVEHDPNIPQGRAGLVGQGGGTPQEREREKNPPSLTLVSGSYVLAMWDVQAKDPANSGMVYTYNHFDLTRIQKGMIKEHWNDLRVDPILSLVQKPN
jgi:predicted SnoaL-like aldol condensation-catalyzing enzyme